MTIRLTSLEPGILRPALFLAIFVVSALASHAQLPRHKWKDIIKQSKEALGHPAPKANPTPTHSAQKVQTIGSEEAPNKAQAQARWPNLAVDEEILSKQQAALLKECQEMNGSGSKFDCSCAIARYSELRLDNLSSKIRQTKAALDSQCSRDQEGGSCQRLKAAFQYETSPEYQTQYPFGPSAPSASGKVSRHRTQVGFSWFWVELKGDCVDASAQQTQQESQCLQAVQSGQLTLTPGTSTKAYCSCVGKRYAEQISKSGITSGASVSAATNAYDQCRSL